MADEQFSTMTDPKLEFIMEVRLYFTRTQVLPHVPDGGMRTAVYVDSGTFEGPKLKGKAVPNSGGDYAYFRPDDVAEFDARYMLQEDDGTLILLRNKGFLWGRHPDTMTKLREWAFNGGDPVAHPEYYLRACPTFEVPIGKHDWLTKYVTIGIGERLPDGNRVRYYTVT